MKACYWGWSVLAFITPLAGWADAVTALEEPVGPVILNVKGNIARTNVGNEAQFDKEMLNALPQHAFETGTPWTEGRSEYSGPLIRTLLEYLGAEGENVHVMALNGYEADIPVSDFYDYDVLLALTRNDRPIPIREYGPMWVLYPFDQDETLLSERIRFRAVWQVMEINVR